MECMTQGLESLHKTSPADAQTYTNTVTPVDLSPDNKGWVPTEPALVGNQ